MKKRLIKSMVFAVVIFLSVLFVLPSTAYADSSMIAFSSDRDGNAGIYTMNIDGSDPKMLINTPVDSVDAQCLHLSPDGSKIAYVSSIDFPGPGGNYEIYIMNADGSDLTRLTNSPGDDGNSSFSPDGSKIVFHSERDGNLEIYIMNVDGSGQTRITNNPAVDYEPAFSPDGTKIAFVSNRDGPLEIYIMNVNGSGQVRLTNIPAPAADWWPCFSPDGSKIAFYSDRDGNQEIYIMNVYGSGQTNLTNNPSQDYYPAFSLDGSKIAFTSDRDGNSEIYIMNADGSGQTRLTNNPAQDYYPTFLPRIIEVIEVSIDIKPGTYPNSINLKSKGVVQVAVLSISNFDASTIDTASVIFAGAIPVKYASKDVNKDRIKDIIFSFNTQDLNLDASSTSATLTAETTSGQPITGTDSVIIIPSK